MKIRALTNFAGVETMHRGEVKEVRDDIAKDLVKCGYVEAVEDAKASPPPAHEDDDKTTSEDDGSNEPPTASKTGKNGKSNK